MHGQVETTCMKSNMGNKTMEELKLNVKYIILNALSKDQTSIIELNAWILSNFCGGKGKNSCSTLMGQKKPEK